MTAQLEQYLREWVARGSAVETSKVIKGRQVAPVPDGLYATVTMIDAFQKGLPIGAGNDAVIAQFTATASIQWYGPRALDTAAAFSV